MSEKQLRVLVADDIASNRTIVGAFLAHLNCTPIFASDGIEAVDLFRQEAPDIVLMDLMMPRLDGFEAIKQIRAMGGDQWCQSSSCRPSVAKVTWCMGLRLAPMTP